MSKYLRFIVPTASLGAIVWALSKLGEGNTVAKKFAEQPWYKDGIRLLEGYQPALDKLGSPLKYDRIDVSNEFNYADDKIARAEVPIIGAKRPGKLFIYATANELQDKWNVDKLEIGYPGTGIKFKFYDRDLIKSTYKND